MLLLDEDGQLCLAKPGAKKLSILSKTPVMEKVAWSAPTLVGSTLYLRDKQHLLAFDLATDPGD
jgi:hypothetical protein